MSRLPDGLPGRLNRTRENHLVDGSNRPLGRDDSYAFQSHTSESSRPARVGPIALQRITSLLTERERAVVSSVDRFSYLTARQIEQLHFREHASQSTAARVRRRVLERLTTAQLLVRLDRQVGGIHGGSAGFVYRVGPLGFRIVHGFATMSGRTREPSIAFLDHTLAIAQLSIDVLVTTDSLSVVTTDDGSDAEPPNPSEQQGDHTKVAILQTEPSCWRRFQLGLGGIEVLKPDLYLATVSREFEDHWFIEIDRGTESTTAVLKKCQTYLAYQRAGHEQQTRGIFPRVLWIVHTNRRLQQLQGLFNSKKATKTSKLFAVVSADDAVTLLTEGTQS